MPKFLFLIGLLLCISVQANAQKIKYKDVYGLLSTRQFEAAEPFLKKYLVDNDDNPNAYLYMGIIYEQKAMKDDILRNTTEAINHMDSAIFYYDKAYKLVDEKELRRNKEYYAMYNRRDLRTGEYGVKLSDVHFEIERSTAALKERIDKVKMTKHYFSQAGDLYNRSNELFRSIQNSFPGLKEFYLRSNEETIEQLKTLAVRFDSCTKAFDHYKVSLGNLPKATYNQSWNLLEIKDFKKDGIQLADFYENNLQVWDYKSFAEAAIQVIQKDLAPIRENLVRYDVEINKLRDRLTADSVSVKSDLTKLVENLLSDKLKRFDEDPLPLAVLALKVAKLEYMSTLAEHRKVRDSSDVFFKLELVKREIKDLKKVDSLAERLLKRNLDDESKNYMYFISNTYSNPTLLKGYIRTEKDFAEREIQKKNTELQSRNEALVWIINGNDSIPLDIDNKATRYKPLLVEENKYTAGITFIDTTATKAYFYTITPSRKPDIHVNFLLDKTKFNRAKLVGTKALATSDSGNNIYFVLLYSESRVEEKIPAVVSKIYRSDGLSWSSNLALTFIPTEIQLMDSGDLIVRSEAGRVALDKSGNLKE